MAFFRNAAKNAAVEHGGMMRHRVGGTRKAKIGIVAAATKFAE
jgi:hypothetical protein